MTYRSSRSAARGFGLTELLVAVAIFLTIIGAIALVFNGSLRSLRQAEQNQQIFEMVRGAMLVMERDLTNAFVAREHGDIYQFYGTPIGFTFVGLVKYNPDDEPNIARVTYVLRRDSGKLARRNQPADNDGIDNDGDNDVLLTDGIDNDGDGLTDEVAADDPRGVDEGVDEPDEADVGNDVPSFSLIRYVERNRDNLESFPIDWTLDSDTVPGFTLGDLVGDPDAVVSMDQLTLNADTSLVGASVRNGLCRQDDLRCLREVEKAARRQIWISMLAGQPSAEFGNTPDYFAVQGLDPEDYVLLENIAVDDFAAAFVNFEDITSPTSSIDSLPLSPAPATEFEAVAYNGHFFQYTEWVHGESMDYDEDEQLTTVRPNHMGYWLDWRNINLANNGVDDNNSNACCNGDDDDGDADVDEPDEANLLIDCDLDELASGAPDDSDGVDNDGDGIVDCDFEEGPVPAAFSPTGEIIYAPGAGPGSPLTPSIPQQVAFRFRLFVEAPTVGAPDFERNFNFQLDIPSAMARVSTTE